MPQTIQASPYLKMGNAQIQHFLSVCFPYLSTKSHHDSLTDELIDGRLSRGLLGLAGDQRVLHVRRHVQLEREREVGVHLAGHCHDV